MKLISISFILVLIEISSGFQYRTVSRYNSKRGLKMEIPSDKQASQDIHKNLLDSNVKDAFQILKKNPMAPLNLDDARLFLNNLNALGSGNPQDAMQMTEAANYIYRRLERQKVLKGFGCVDGEYPEKSLDVSPTKLEQVTGLNIKALTPRQRPTYWRIAGVGLCLTEYFIGTSLGIDPLYTLIPITFLALLSDQFFLKGAAFETVYQTLFPEYKQKVIAHEAGHFLIAYLMGLSVRGVVTNAWEARKYPDLQGQAGTMFYDSRLMDEVSSKKVKRTSLDRVTVVIMAGIAAEALKFDKAEGGASDEQSLINFFTSVQPPWNLLRIQGQARWGVMQALLLIKEHQASYDALYEALVAGKGVGDAVLAIEQNLPENLPSAQRIAEREQRLKRIEADKMLRHIQKMTWKVGGVEPLDESKALFPSEGEDTVTATDMTKETGSGTGVSEPAGQQLDAVSLFTQKIRTLEEVARTGNIPVSGDPEGVWVNGLDAMQKAMDNAELIDLSATNSKSPSKISMPEPLPDFEKRVEELQATELPLNPAVVPLLQSNIRSPAFNPKELLISHRGYQVKQLENQELENKRKVSKIDKRLIELKKEMIKRESLTPGSRSSRW